MEELLKRKEGESDFEHKVRLCLMKLNKEIDLDWIEIVELLGLECSSDHLRKLSYAYKEFSNYMSEKKMSEVEDNELLSKFEEKEMKIKEERIRLADVRRRLNVEARANARYNNTVDLIRESITELENTKPFKKHDEFKIAGENEAVLMLSDLHIGINIDNYFNKYNVEIAKQRLNKLAIDVINKCNINKVNKIHIIVGGDLISGMIHKQLIQDADVDLIKSITLAWELISQTIKTISDKINIVEVHFCAGNHSRVEPNKKESHEKNNFEYLIFDFIKERLKPIENIVFAINKYHDEIVDFYIFNKLILATHGDKDKPVSVAKNLSNFLRENIYKIYLGHYHSYQSFDCNGTHVTVNGSIVSTDNYAFSLRLNSEPYQVLTIFNSETKNEECEYKIWLK